MIIEKGYYHPERGYWQSIINTEVHGENGPDLPEGAIEVPVQPSHLHKMVEGEWIAPTQKEIDEDASNTVRLIRDHRLVTEVDPIVSNPLRWQSMSGEEQQRWADYRQALLDVPQQDGFPHEIEWPTL